jgi:DNA polymerase III delta prime subunit
MSEPPLRKYEQEISDAADEVYRSGKTGYNWGAVDEILQRELGIEGPTRCKKANNSGRAANVFTESMDKRIQLYLVFIAEPYTIERFLRVAYSRIKRFPNVKTAAILDRTSGVWRVREIVEREGVGLAEEILEFFPAVSEIRYVHSKPPAPQPTLPGAEQPEPEEEEEAVDTVPVVAEDVFESEMVARETRTSGLDDLPGELVDVARERGLSLDRSLATDLLAVTLSSQLVLFAGPSGTGKSTMARLLRSFFASVDRQFEIEALRQWLSPDDLVGYYSVLGQQYATASGTTTIVDMHEVSVGSLSREGAQVEGPPILLVEEMNLSAPEGYLAPVIHGLSGVSEPILRWELHTGGREAVDEAISLELPEVVLIGPYPRVFGTINVDASAHAPARKVAARSSVVLLEPSELTEESLEELAKSAAASEDGGEAGRNEEFLGDPLAALKGASATEVTLLAGKLSDFVAALDGVPVSSRAAKRSLAYMAYFRALCGSEPGSADRTLQLAVENAFAHCILPTVEPGRFLSTLQALERQELAPAAEDGDGLGGLLGMRVERLLATAYAGTDFGIVDFWSALS